MKTNIILSASIAAVIALVIAVGFKVSAPTQTTDQNQFGALTGPDLSLPWLGWGGVRTYQFSQSLTQNASTTCNWQTPAATSTVKIAVRFTLASTSALLVEMGKAASKQATTTLLGAFTVGASAQATLVSSSTQADFSGAVTEPFVAAPSTWLAVKIGGGNTGSVPTGRCNFSAVTIP